MSQLVAELVDECPCANEVAVHVRSLVVHGIPVFDGQSVCVKVVEIKLPSTWVKVTSVEHVTSLSKMVLIAAGEHLEILAHSSRL